MVNTREQQTGRRWLIQLCCQNFVFPFKISVVRWHNLRHTLIRSHSFRLLFKNSIYKDVSLARGLEKIRQLSHVIWTLSWEFAHLALIERLQCSAWAKDQRRAWDFCRCLLVQCRMTQAFLHLWGQSLCWRRGSQSVLKPFSACCEHYWKKKPIVLILCYKFSWS